MPYEMLAELKEAIRAFIEYYNYGRYHEGLGNVTLWDVCTGKHLEIIQRRKEAKAGHQNPEGTIIEHQERERRSLKCRLFLWA